MNETLYYLLPVVLVCGCVSKPLPKPPPKPKPLAVIAPAPRKKVARPSITPEKKVVKIALASEQSPVELEMRQVPVSAPKPAETAPTKEGVWFGATEITIAQYICYLEATGDEKGIDWNDKDCPLVRRKGGYQLSGTPSGTFLNQPMVEIDRNAAERYCRWLTEEQKTDLLPGYAFRLPSRDEWERAAKEDRLPPLIRVQAWLNHNSRGKSRRVGSRPAGRNGYYDFYGNVWEWSSSRTAKGAFLLNGGSWLTPLEYAAQANTFFADETQATVGFRVILLKD